MNKYKLITNADSNVAIELESTTFQNSVEESLNNLKWYVIDEGDQFLGVSAIDPNHTIELHDNIFEDAQYETLIQLGYYISSHS